MITTPAKTTIRVVLIDDQGMMRAALSSLLERQPGLTIVNQAASCSAALDGAAELPDVILLSMPLAAGTDGLQELLEAAAGARLLLMTNENGPEAHLQAIQLGATGLVTKDRPPEFLVKAIEKVHAGEAWFDRSAIAEVLTEIARSNGRKRADSEEPGFADLTRREREIFTLVAQGLKNRQIAEKLFISDVTVRHHLTSIFSKVGVSGRLELMVYAFRHGLVESPKAAMQHNG